MENNNHSVVGETSARRRKILIFSLAYQPFVGGAEVAIKEITSRLGDDFEFDMITVNLDGQQKPFERMGKVNVYRIGHGKIAKYLFLWTAYQLAKKLHQKNNYQLVWAMMANQAGLAALQFKKKFPAVKYLLSLQEGDSELDIWLRTWFIRPLYKNIYRTADQIQAISNFLARRARKFGAKCDITVIPNGVDAVIASLRGLPAQAVNPIVEGIGQRRIITTSRLVKKNGIADLIKAMSSVDGRLTILGGGKLEFKLKSLTKNLNLENKVEFLGEVSNKQVYQYLKQSDVFVRPSLSEGLGNAFLEAMAMGVPVVATPVGGIPDFLNDGQTGLPAQTGWFCKVKDSKSIAEKINYILDEKNKNTVAIVVETAHQMVIAKYDWNKISQDMKNIIDKLI